MKLGAMTVARAIGLAAIGSVAGCQPPASSLAPSNDITFRVEWSSTADLDLYVREPGGAEISRHQLHSASGGVHTGDCNATPESMCANPSELVYWPNGAEDNDMEVA